MEKKKKGKTEHQLTDHKPKLGTGWLWVGLWKKQVTDKRNVRRRWPVQTGYVVTHTKPKPPIFFKKIGHTLMTTSQLIIKLKTGKGMKFKSDREFQ